MYIELARRILLSHNLLIIHLRATVKDSDSRICQTTCLLILFQSSVQTSWKHLPGSWLGTRPGRRASHELYGSRSQGCVPERPRSRWAGWRMRRHSSRSFLFNEELPLLPIQSH